MKLLVLAQTPPPLHGQSFMVQTLIDGLPAPGIEVCHVPLVLSRDSQDIGRWRPGKIFTAIRAALAARRVAKRERPDALYYVPAPGKRGALYRDLVVLFLCRSSCPTLVLHWHSPGLGAWVQTRATGLERALAQRVLGRADLSLVLTPTLTEDAAVFEPRATVVVTNGLPDPGTPAPRPPRAGRPAEILFLGMGGEAKGLFTAIEALKLARARFPHGARLTFAGNFESAADRERFQRDQAELGADTLVAFGFADETAKRQLFTQADVFCFPSAYLHEGQPLVLLEALAHDLPIVSTRWRGIPDTLPDTGTRLVAPRSPEETADALVALLAEPPPHGALRQHFLTRYTREHHLAALAAALKSLQRNA